MRATCLFLLILHNLIILILFSVKHKTCSPSLRNFLQPPLTFSLLDPKNVHNIQF
jgi:hypothetical protein